MDEHEKYIISTTLQASRHNKEQAAAALGIDTKTLKKLLKKHGLVRPRFAKPLPIPVGRADDDR